MEGRKGKSVLAMNLQKRRAHVDTARSIQSCQQQSWRNGTHSPVLVDPRLLLALSILPALDYLLLDPTQ